MSDNGPNESGLISVVTVFPSAGLPRKLARPVPKITNARPATIWFARRTTESDEECEEEFEEETTYTSDLCWS